MTPAFGFSLGDFVSVINLIRKISKALKETGGASAEYQDAVVELKGLKHVLQRLEALEPTEDNVSHVNAIRGMAFACKLPLQDFITKLDKYESSLGPWQDRTHFRGAARKAKWAVSFGQEVEKLRAMVAAKQISINLLLTTQCSQTLSSMNIPTKQEHRDLISKVVEHRAALQRVQGIVEHVENKMEGMQATSQVKLDAISSKADAIQVPVISLRSLSEQMMAFFRNFPREIRDLLKTLVYVDWRTYQAVLQIQERLTRSPTSLHDSNIKFTNVLGEYRELPYEYFCHWEPFEGFLRAQFKNKPGETKVLEGDFHIVDIENQSAIVKKEHWSRSVSQGTTLTMSMIMSHLQRKPGCCPRPDCIGIGLTNCDTSSLLTCGICYLNFFPTENGLEDLFNRVIVSEEEIARQQVDEDLRLYGSRPQPPDAIDVGESHQQTGFFPQRTASEFEAAVDRPAKVRKDFNFQTVTAIDWNSGTSPLDAWLNQSAVPSTGSVIGSQVPSRPEKDSVAQELEEIQVFRSVHVATAPGTQVPRGDSIPQEIAFMELGAQIYYRNIMDRYPPLPTYLALRLAQANHDRAERLRQLRHSGLGERLMVDSPTLPRHAVPGIVQRPDNKIVSKLEREPCDIASDFWSGGSPHSRPASIDSRSSSMNSSLRGSLNLDLEERFAEQEPNFHADSSRPSSADLLCAQSSLFPPPAELGMKLSFECDICGKSIRVNRRYDRQRHVLADLRPYLCTFPNCIVASKTYTSREKYLVHEFDHDNQNGPLTERIICLFCGERVRTYDRAQHVGRHMEEIAFSVVSKPYDQWSFYSNSTSAGADASLQQNAGQ